MRPPALVAQGGVASFFVQWSKAEYRGDFCPAVPRAVSDESVLTATFEGECGRVLRLVGVAPGSAHVEFFDGDRLLGGWDVGVAVVDHVVIVRADIRGDEPQDPPHLEATVGEALALSVVAYDAEGHTMFADPDGPTWQSDDSDVLAVVDTTREPSLR